MMTIGFLLSSGMILKNSWLARPEKKGGATISQPLEADPVPRSPPRFWMYSGYRLDRFEDEGP